MANGASRDLAAVRGPGDSHRPGEFAAAFATAPFKLGFWVPATVFLERKQRLDFTSGRADLLRVVHSVVPDRQHLPAGFGLCEVRRPVALDARLARNLPEFTGLRVTVYAVALQACGFGLGLHRIGLRAIVDAVSLQESLCRLLAVRERRIPVPLELRPFGLVRVVERHVAVLGQLRAFGLVGRRLVVSRIPLRLQPLCLRYLLAVLPFRIPMPAELGLPGLLKAVFPEIRVLGDVLVSCRQKPLGRQLPALRIHVFQRAAYLRAVVPDCGPMPVEVRLGDFGLAVRVERRARQRTRLIRETGVHGYDILPDKLSAVLAMRHAVY